MFLALADSPGAARAAPCGIPVKQLRGFGLSEWSTLHALAKEFRPDLVFAYGGPETVGTLALRAAGHRFRTIRFRGADGDWAFNPRAIQHRISHSHIDLVITPGERLTRALNGKFKAPVVTIPIGCDSGKFLLKAQSTAPRRNEVQILGRLDPVKGHREFIELFADAIKNWPTEKTRPLLHIIGESSNLSASEIHAWALSQGLREEIDFRLTSRRVENLADLMSGAALAAIPSVGSEVICRVAVEYLLCGVPLFVSGVGSLDDHVGPGLGVSARGLGKEEASRLLQTKLVESLAENDDSRRARSEIASRRWSIAAMANSLRERLGELSNR